MFDESTDCTVTEQLVLHCRYIEKDTDGASTMFGSRNGVVAQLKELDLPPLVFTVLPTD